MSRVEDNPTWPTHEQQAAYLQQLEPRRNELAQGDAGMNDLPTLTT